MNNNEDDRWKSVGFECLHDAENWVKSQDSVEFHHFVGGERVLETIVEYKQLRLSRFDRMRNDPSEVRFASEVFEDCIDDLLNLGLMSEPEADRLKESVEYTDKVRMVVLNEKEKVFRPEDVRVIPYVVCFTRSYDDCMWDEYESTAALGVRIDESFLRFFMRGNDPSREPVDQDNYIRLLKVQYDGPVTRRKVRRLIMDAKAVGDIDRWCEIVHGMFMDCRLAIKPAKFEHEGEYRLVYLMPEDPKENDPALRYVCGTHYDLTEDGVEENTYDPRKDGYVWVDISEFITGVTLRGSDLSREHLMELAGKGDRFYVCRHEDMIGDRGSIRCAGPEFGEADLPYLNLWYSQYQSDSYYGRSIGSRRPRSHLLDPDPSHGCSANPYPPPPHPPSR